MALYWIVATKEEPKRLIQLVEREEGLNGLVIACKDAENEQTLWAVSESIVDPNYVTIVDDALENDTDRRIADAWERLRGARNIMLKTSDWTQLPDSPVDIQAWATYRQALRDLPQNTVDPEDTIDWPVEPEE